MLPASALRALLKRLEDLPIRGVRDDGIEPSHDLLDRLLRREHRDGGRCAVGAGVVVGHRQHDPEAPGSREWMRLADRAFTSVTLRPARDPNPRPEPEGALRTCRSASRDA